MSVVVLPPLAAPVDQLWHLLLALGELLSVGWTIVGGQMVLVQATSATPATKAAEASESIAAWAAPTRSNSSDSGHHGRQ